MSSSIRLTCGLSTSISSRAAQPRDSRHDLDNMLADWGIDPSSAEAGLKEGEELDWDQTIAELLKA